MTIEERIDRIERAAAAYEARFSKGYADEGEHGQVTMTAAMNAFVNVMIGAE